MKVNLKTPPRGYKVGKSSQIFIQDMGTISLEPNEQITFINSENGEYDLCCKEWGYYATPSINDRLKRFGYKTALVQNSKGQLYVMIVEIPKMEAFQRYIQEEDNFVVKWLDDEPLRQVKC